MRLQIKKAANHERQKDMVKYGQAFYDYVEKLRDILV